MAEKRRIGMVGAAVVALSAAVTGAPSAFAQDAPLIPRGVFFGNPERIQARMSPDGRWLSWLAPVDGVMNVWVSPADDPSSGRAVTDDTDRGIRTHFWAYTSGDIVYLQDKDGDENWRVFGVDVETLERRDLTPFEGVAAQIQETSRHYPEEILIGLNSRDPRVHDLYRVNIRTGELRLVHENPGYVGYVTDERFEARFAQRFTEDGGLEMVRLDGRDEYPFIKVSMEDSLTTSPIGFDASGDVLFMIDSRGRDTAALTAMDLETGESAVIAESELSDISRVLVHPTERRVQAASFNYDRERWVILDDSVRADFEELRRIDRGDPQIVSRTLDDRTWVIAFLQDTGPVRYYAYDRAERNARYLFTSQPSLDNLPLSEMRPVRIRSRDGLTLMSYLTLPPDAPSAAGRYAGQPLPMVLLVHGGPWARDSWGYNPYHQWLANRGYAVLSVNFRGSTGFGKSFLNAGNLEWAGKMHDDLLDAVDWAVEEGVADRDRVAIMGGSYGGYATLVGLTFTPEVFAAGVDIVGPSDIITLLDTIPAYWKPAMELFRKRVGDPDTEEGRKLLRERSPIHRVDEIRRPLLIAQGAKDPRVKQSESDQIVSAMETRGIPVTYVLFPDEGHGFARPENDMAFTAVTEAFLALHLGGRYEPIGEDFEGSSISSPTGSEHVPGFGEALDSHGK